jgi:hypothetical protein
MLWISHASRVVGRQALPGSVPSPSWDRVGHSQLRITLGMWRKATRMDTRPLQGHAWACRSASFGMQGTSLVCVGCQREDGSEHNIVGIRFWWLAPHSSRGCQGRFRAISHNTNEELWLTPPPIKDPDKNKNPRNCLKHCFLVLLLPSGISCSTNTCIVWNFKLWCIYV